jgi:hypothetical protein
VQPQFAYTRHQARRGARADATSGDKLLLLKKVSELRLTYQIRMLAYAAYSGKKKLVIRVPKEAKIHRTLREFVREFEKLVAIERA